jgi:sterol 3beta-glucosyltransferase
MTRILITTIGSRGDSHGLQYAYMNDDFVKLTESQEGQAAMEGGSKLALLKKVIPMLRSMLQDEWQAAQDFQPDALVYHPKSLGSYHIAEKLNIPFFMAFALPLYTPTREFPVPIMSGIKLGGAFNRFTYRLMAMAMAPYMGVINDFRVNMLGLAKRGRFASELVKPNGDPVPILYAYSSHVLPIPKDYPTHAHVTGYWFLDCEPTWQPSAELTRFIEAGDPPVYVGFGSMGGSKAQARAQIVIEALQKSSQRGLLASGWGGLRAGDLPETIFMIDQAPHDWLFPRVAAVVHHGGAGTTGAGLRAGKPTVIVPFIVDQPFWGKVVHELGIGPKPIPQSKLTVDLLTDAICTAVTDKGMRQRAEEIGEQIRSENGVGNAVGIIRREKGVPVSRTSASVPV